MPPFFEELDYRPTPMGALSLRRRQDMTLGREVWEIKLGEEFLMSSAFVEAEIALSRIGLAECVGEGLDVCVGGLGLGYTAKAALEADRLASLCVVEYMEDVIDWHREGLLPLGPDIAGDPRCRLIRGDFFAMAASAEGFDPDTPGRRFDAVLLDIDHTPDQVLAPAHAAFYEPDGLRRLSRHIMPGGVFALWSNDPPDEAFTTRLAEVFATARGHSVEFPNPVQGGTSVNTVYVARVPG